MTVNIPASTVTISVKAINTGTPETQLPAVFFLQPVPKGREVYTSPIYAFLLEHSSGKRLLFDLGMRKGDDGLSPAIKGLIKLWNDSGLRGLVVEKDIVEQLKEGGVSPADIDTVFWSHTHLDHIGDMRKFSSRTELIVGPGSDLSTYPTVPDAALVEEDLSGRKVTELKDFPLKIGDYDALDYFSDGSLYILNAPGHCIGHISALVRVTPTSFVLLGGDTCHHPAQIRPNKHCLCPFASFPSNTPDVPLLSFPDGPSAYHDRESAVETLGKLAQLDADPNVLALLAHDSTLPGVIDEFPKDVNAWKEKGWKDKIVWAFLEKGHPANRFELNEA